MIFLQPGRQGSPSEHAVCASSPRAHTLVQRACIHPRFFLPVAPSGNYLLPPPPASPRVLAPGGGMRAAQKATLAWQAPWRVPPTGYGPCARAQEAFPLCLPGAPGNPTQAASGVGTDRMLVPGCWDHPSSPVHASPPPPPQLWDRSAGHLRLLILEAMKAGVSPRSFGVSTSAPNTMRALIISTLSFCWG